MTHLESELNNAIREVNAKQRISVEEFRAQQSQGRPLKLKLIGLGLALFAAWAYTGFMGPSALLSVFTIHSECVLFARQKDVFKVYGDDYRQGSISLDNVEARNLRIRHGAWVVDLFANKVGSRDLQHRTCVMDGQTIQITSVLQDWMYK